MNYVKYSRSFIILEDKGSDFRENDEKIKGHVKVEFKNNVGTLTCSIQNLKYYPQGDYFYKLYLFGNKNNETIFTNSGTLFIDKLGKSHHSYKFNALNIDGKNHSFHDYRLVAIIAQPNDTVLKDEEIYPVLTGEIRSLGIEEETPLFELEKHIPIHSSHNQVSKVSQVSQESTVSTASLEIQALSRHKFDISPYFNNYIRTICSNLGNILPFYPEIKPFERDGIGCKWWKVINVMSIPFFNTSQLQGYPEYLSAQSSPQENIRELPASCHDLIYKYHHYIFGIERQDNEIVYYYYGIPGRYLSEEQPDRGASGFKYWQPLKGSEKEEGDHGYWIIAVKADTGELETLT